ncbi:MAG: hypothetical protein AB8I08_30840 [Sandaracinaceae bacterium]
MARRAAAHPARSRLTVARHHVGWALGAAVAILAGRLLSLRAEPADQWIAWALVSGAMIGPLVVLLDLRHPPVREDLSPSPSSCSCTPWDGVCDVCLGVRAPTPKRPALDTMQARTTDTVLGRCARCGGEAQLVEGKAVCSHCRAPLVPALEVVSHAKGIADAQAESMLSVDEYVAWQKKVHAEALARWLARAHIGIAVLAASWLLIALLAA